MFVWGDADVPIVQQGVQRCGRHVSGEYRFEMLHNLGHFMLEQKPDAVADLLLDWICTHPISTQHGATNAAAGLPAEHRRRSAAYSGWVRTAIMSN
jgi:hypothetical protein